MRKIFTILTCCFCILTLALKAQEERSETLQSKDVNPALLVIDIQNAYLPYMSEEDVKSAMEIINKAIDGFHQKQLPVIRIYHEDLGYGPPRGSEGFEFPKSIRISDKDPKVIKHYENGFTKTCLDSLIKELKVNTLFLCGLSATGCVLGTYFWWHGS